MKKRIIAVLTCLVMSLTLVTVSAADFRDISGEPCEEAVSLLCSLGILKGSENGLFNPNNNLSRGEMAAIIARTMNVGDMTVSEDGFTDVEAEHWAYNDINVLYKLGIISGTSESEFDPEGQVTFNQALKIVVSLLGYNVVAEKKGGYPTGYIIEATRLNLFKGISEKGEEAITRRDMSLLLFNALDAELMDMDVLGGGDTKYKQGDETILSKYFEVVKYTGIITANYFTAIDGGEQAKSGMVRLGADMDFDAGTTNAGELLGRNVTLFADISEELNYPVIKAITANSRSAVTVIDADELNPSDTSTQEISYYDEKNDEENSLSVSPDAMLIYNGTAVSPWDATNLTSVSYGTITLIANNGNDVDVIIIEEFKTMVVNGSNPDLKSVFFKNGTEMVIDPNDSSKRIEFINKDGSAASVGDCEYLDILSVAESTDGNKLKIIRSTDALRGKVSGVDDDKVIMDGVSYKVRFWDPAMTMPYAGATVAYRLDFRGNIVDAGDTNVGLMQYGFLVGADLVGGTMMGEPRLKIFHQDGSMRIFEVANTVKVSGKNIKKDNLLPQTPGEFTDLYDITSGGVIRQLLKFRTNEQGKITTVMTENYSSPDGTEYLRCDAHINDERNLNGEPAVYIHGSIMGFAAGQYLVRDETIAFVIPPAGSDDMYYYIKRGTNTWESNQAVDADSRGAETYKNVRMYDVNDCVISALVWEPGGIFEDMVVPGRNISNLTTGMITRISRGLDMDDSEAISMTIIDKNGAFWNVKAKPDMECTLEYAITNLEKEPETNTADGVKTRKPTIPASSLRQGDVVQFRVNDKPPRAVDGNLLYLNVFFRAETPSPYEVIYLGGNLTATTANSNYGNYSIACGRVIKLNKYGYIMETNKFDTTTVGPDPSVTYQRFKPFKGKVYVYDMKKKENTVAEYEDIKVGDLVLSWTSTSTQWFTIVYRR